MARNSQEQIVAQSQLKLTLDYFQMCGICPSLSDVIKVSTMLEKYVKDGYSTALVDAFNRIDNYIGTEYSNEQSTNEFNKPFDPEKTKSRIEELIQMRKNREENQ